MNPAVKPVAEADDRVQAVVSQHKAKVTLTIILIESSTSNWAIEFCVLLYCITDLLEGSKNLAEHMQGAHLHDLPMSE